MYRAFLKTLVFKLLFHSNLLIQAMKAEEENQKRATKLLEMDERKRPYNSMRASNSVKPTDEEMEAYHMKKRRLEDPMANFM